MNRARSMLLSILILVIIIVIEVFFVVIIIVFVIIAGITPPFGTQPRRRRRRIGVPVLRLRAAPDRALRLCSGTRGRHGAARAELEVVVPVLLWCGAWGDASACFNQGVKCGWNGEIGPGVDERWIGEVKEERGEEREGWKEESEESEKGEGKGTYRLPRAGGLRAC